MNADSTYTDMLIRKGASLLTVLVSLAGALAMAVGCATSGGREEAVTRATPVARKTPVARARRGLPEDDGAFVSARVRRQGVPASVRGAREGGQGEVRRLQLCRRRTRQVARGVLLLPRLATAIKWAPYFDGANFASRITCPVRVLVGFADDTVPPSAVYATYNEVRAEDRAIVNGIGMGHGCDKNLVAQLNKWLYAQERR